MELTNEEDVVFNIKYIKWQGRSCPIITQNENGPCPLIALTNVLLLERRIKLKRHPYQMTDKDIIKYLSDSLLSSFQKGELKGSERISENNLHDIINMLPTLQTGLNIDLRFNNITDFNPTPEIFSLFNISIYHGWIIDPSNYDEVNIMKSLSYNQLIEKMIDAQGSSDVERVSEASIVQSFLRKSASQLTHHGLFELTAKVPEGKPCILFRNNHFVTLIKKENSLYQLVTDLGFLHQNVVWETLNNITGDSKYVGSNFVELAHSSTLVALSLQPDQQIKELELIDIKERKLGISNIPKVFKDLDESVTTQEEKPLPFTTSIRKEKRRRARTTAPLATKQDPPHQPDASGKKRKRSSTGQLKNIKKITREYISQIQTETNTSQNTPIGVFWDIENIPVPRFVSSSTIVKNIRASFFEGHKEVDFMVACDHTKLSERVLKELDEENVDILWTRCGKNAADSKLIRKMLNFVRIHPAPATLILITDDGDFYEVTKNIRQSNYNVVLLHREQASTKLIEISSRHVLFNTLF